MLTRTRPTSPGSSIPAELVSVLGRILATHAEPLLLTVDQADRAMSAAMDHRVIGAVAWAVEEGRVRLPSAHEDQLASAHMQHMRECLVIDQMLIDALDFCTADTAIVLKGVANAHLDYPDPAWRTYQDADLLVPATLIDGYVRALERAGFERELPPRTPTWDRRFTKDLTLYAPSGPELDLHRTIVPGAFGHWIDLPELHRHTTEFQLGPRRARALDRTGRIIHTSYAMTVGEAIPRLSHALDLAVLLMSDVNGEATREALALVAPWKGTSLIAEAWRRCCAAFDVEALRNSAAGQLLDTQRAHPGFLTRVAWRGYRAAGGTNTATLLLGAIGLRSARERVAYARQLALPSREYRSARRAQGRAQEWTAALGDLIGRRR